MPSRGVWLTLEDLEYTSRAYAAIQVKEINYRADISASGAWYELSPMAGSTTGARVLTPHRDSSDSDI